MSATLGKIHFWLFNQIKIIDDRNQVLLEMAPKLKDQYESNLNGVELTEALNGQHIHPGLESLIIEVQSREVEILGDLIDSIEFNDLRKLYYEHGTKTAREAGVRGSTLQETTQGLKEILLERMPCDRLTKIEMEDNLARIIRDEKLHTEFWIDSKISVERMHQLYCDWINGALSVINPSVNYERKIYEGSYEDLLKI